MYISLQLCSSASIPVTEPTVRSPSNSTDSLQNKIDNEFEILKMIPGVNQSAIVELTNSIIKMISMDAMSKQYLHELVCALKFIIQYHSLNISCEFSDAFLLYSIPCWFREDETNCW